MKLRSSMKTAPAIVLIALLCVACDPFERSGPNADGSKTREVEAMWSELPRYEGMQEVYESRNSTAKRVLVSKHFRSTASLEQVKEFYVKTLSAAGWQLVEDHKLSDWGRDLGGHYLSFRKADYKLSIEYAGKANDDWDYGIGIAWSDL